MKTNLLPIVFTPFRTKPTEASRTFVMSFHLSTDTNYRAPFIDNVGILRTILVYLICTNTHPTASWKQFRRQLGTSVVHTLPSVHGIAFRREVREPR